MRTLGRVFTGLLAVSFSLLRTALALAAAGLVVAGAFWLTPWLGWPVAVVVAVLVVVPQLMGALFTIPLVFISAFADDDPPPLPRPALDAEDSARLRRIASEKEAEKRRRLEGALHYPDRGDAALEDVKGPGAIDIHGIDIHDIDIHDIDIHDIDNYAGALAELARLGAVVASGNGNAKTRRSFVKAMSEVVEGRQRAKERVTKIRGWLSDARTAGVIALPSELLPHDPEATGYSPAVSPRVTAEQLVGVYSVNAQSFPPLFLLPSGVFSQQGPHDGFTQLTLAGRWRLTEDRVELTGFQIFEQDCGPDFLTHTRFHVDLRVEASWPTKSLTPPSPPAEEQPRDRMRLTAIKLGADWRNDERWTDWTDCERASTALIQQAESRLGEAERVVDRCEADRRLEPTVLTDAQVRLVLELTSAAEALARNGLVEEPLQQYAALLAQHPSHAEYHVRAIQDLFPARLWRRLSNGDEEFLFLTPNLEFIRLVRKDQTIDVDAGDWFQRGQQLTLFGVQQQILDWPKPGDVPGGYHALPSIALPDPFGRFLRMPARPMDEQETLKWLGGMATMWKGRLGKKDTS